METINIYAVAISWKPNKEGLVPIAIRFDYAGQRVGHEKVNHKIKLSDWDSDHRRVRSTCRNYQLINQLIDNKLTKHRTFFLKRETFGQPVSREFVKQYIKSGCSTEMFCAFAEHMINTKTLADNQPLSAETKRRYMDEVNRLKNYRGDISFHQLTPEFLSGYRHWLQHGYEKKDRTRLDPNSIWKALSFLRSVYNYAVRHKIILSENNPFAEFEVGSFKTNLDKIKYLELAQVQQLEKTLIEKKEVMRDLTYRIGWRFLVMCVSGLRISDAMLLNDMMFNDAGHLDFKPHKTRRHDNKALVPITSDRQRRYLEMSLKLPLPETDPKSFRTTFNTHLKILAAWAQIPINLTSHVGRHTMGGFLVDGNVDTPVAKVILGVKSERTINTYRHVKDSKIKTEAEKLKNVM